MDFSPKRLAETEVLSVDFVNLLPDGVQIQSAVWTVATTRGTDKSSEMLVGTASISGSIVSQLVTGGVKGVKYAPICTATTSDGQTLILPETEDGLLLIV